MSSFEKSDVITKLGSWFAMGINKEMHVLFALVHEHLLYQYILISQNILYISTHSL